MAGHTSDTRQVGNPERELERQLIDRYLHMRGYDEAALSALPEDVRTRLLRDASTYAAGQLAEIEARDRFVQDLRGERS